jgi:hypothetical protein
MRGKLEAHHTSLKSNSEDMVQDAIFKRQTTRASQSSNNISHMGCLLRQCKAAAFEAEVNTMCA